MKHLSIATICLAVCAPAAGQQSTDTGAWSIKGDRVTASASGISMPTRAAKLSLTKTAESSEKGKGMDNVAQFRSEDSEVLGTVYVFFSTYADTALATWATDRAIRNSYGPDVTLVSDTIVDIPGAPSAATRRLYDKLVVGSGNSMVSAAGFVRAGSWLVGLRVSGPPARRAEVEAGFDALVAGLRFDGTAKPMTAAPLKITAPCPIGKEKPAKYLNDKKAGGNAMFASLLGGSIMLKGKTNGTTDKVDLPPAFPANGASALCVRGTVLNGDTRQDVLQPASPDAGQIMLAPIDDAGGIVAVEPMLLGDGYVVKHYGIGFTNVMGSFGTMPSLDQLGAILSGRDKKGGTVRSSNVFTSDGKSTIHVNSDTLK